MTPSAPPTAVPKPPAPASAPPVSRAASPRGTRAKLGRLKPNTAVRCVLNCVEGWGKTSAAAFMPNPVILCSAGETGYQTLLGAGLVPEIDGAVIESWPELLATLDGLIEDCPYDTVVLDAISGFEAMLHDMVCTRDFDGDRGPKAFLHYHKGYERAVFDWVGMLAKLERLHSHSKTIMLLSHVGVKTTKNPMGEDFDSYVGSVNPRTWAPTKECADVVLFGKFHSIIIKDDRKKSKGIGGTDRVLYCEKRDAFDAKNRYQMPAELDVPNDPSQVWATIINSMKRKG